MPMTQSYDTGVDIRNQRGVVQKEMGDRNPLMDALKTLQLYVTSQREQGNEALTAAYVSFLDALRGGQGAAQQNPQQQQPGQAFNPFEAPEEQPATARRPMTGTPEGQRSEMQGKARVMGM